MAIKLKCMVCGCVIQSKSRHDFVQCDCNNCFVDGGDDYCRIGIQDKSMVEVWDEDKNEFIPYTEKFKD